MTQRPTADIPVDTSADGTATVESESAPAEATGCPLCSFTASADDLVVHLQTSHRKSALARAVVDRDTSTVSAPSE